MTQFFQTDIKYIISSKNIDPIKDLIEEYILLNEDIYILKYDSIIFKEELLNKIRSSHNFYGELIIFSDKKRYGRKYVFNNSKVVEYYYGNYITYDNFISTKINNIYKTVKKHNERQVELCQI